MRIPTPILTLTAAFTLITGTPMTGSLMAAPLGEQDRARVLSELYASRKQFLDAIANLSEAQWKYKAGPDRWSIQQVAEHITAAETFLRGMVSRDVMGSPADPAKAEKRRAGNAAMDEKILEGLRDRTHKAVAPDEITPKGTWPTAQATAAAFKTARDGTLDYVRATHDDLRDRFFKPEPDVEMDGVQALLMIAGHTERHVAQIEEVKQSPGYPKH